MMVSVGNQSELNQTVSSSDSPGLPILLTRRLVTKKWPKNETSSAPSEMYEEAERT